MIHSGTLDGLLQKGGKKSYKNVQVELNQLVCCLDTMCNLFIEVKMLQGRIQELAKGRGTEKFRFTPLKRGINY